MFASRGFKAVTMTLGCSASMITRSDWGWGGRPGAGPVLQRCLPHQLPDRPDLAADERFNDMMTRARNAPACDDELEATFLTRPLADWRTEEMEILLELGRDWDAIAKLRDSGALGGSTGG